MPDPSSDEPEYVAVAGVGESSQFSKAVQRGTTVLVNGEPPIYMDSSNSTQADFDKMWAEAVVPEGPDTSPTEAGLLKTRRGEH